MNELYMVLQDPIYPYKEEPQIVAIFNNEFAAYQYVQMITKYRSSRLFVYSFAAIKFLKKNLTNLTQDAILSM